MSALLLALLSVGQLPSVGRVVGPGRPVDPPLVRWDIYRDSGSPGNHGHWSNWMPAEASKMIKLNLAEKIDPQAGESCIRVDVRFAEPGWCGVAVASAQNYWGEKPGAAFDLRRAKSLVFYAKGVHGTEVIQVKTGITGDKPHGDSSPQPAETEWLTLSKGWKKYELSLTDVNLERCVTPFVFVTSKERNPDSRSITFYLDECHILLSAEK